MKYLLFLLFTTNVISQNKQVLYDFGNIPQNLLVNPSTKAEYNFHIGIPLLSGISTNIGTTGFTLADLFRNDKIAFKTKLKNVLNSVSQRDYVHINTQVDFLNGGFRYDDKTYFSFGFYGEVDAFANIPKDILQLINEGNGTYINRSFSIAQLNVKAEVLSVFHIGITRKMSEKLTIGGRLKIYSGVLNAQTSENKGTFTTKLGQKNIYKHFLSNVDVEFNTSGIYKKNENGYKNINGKTILNKILLGGNLGIGVDIGITYRLSSQIQFSASLLDVGVINYSKDIRNEKVKGKYTFEGINFLYNATDTNYLESLKIDFKAKVPIESTSESYTSWRTIKFNGAVKYSFSKSRNSKNCYDISYKKYYDNTIGIQLYSAFKPSRSQLELTGFYQRKFGDFLSTKVTYTVNDYSATNIGIGASINIGIVNLYAIANNVLKFTDITNSNYASFQFGINLIFN